MRFDTTNGRRQFSAINGTKNGTKTPLSLQIEGNLYDVTSTALRLNR